MFHLEIAYNVEHVVNQVLKRLVMEIEIDARAQDIAPGEEVHVIPCHIDYDGPANVCPPIQTFRRD